MIKFSAFLLKKIFIFTIIGLFYNICNNVVLGATFPIHHLNRKSSVALIKDTTQNVDAPGNYLNGVITELKKQWSNNRNINIVFHGHSVPGCYFRTPNVYNFESYPFLLLKGLTRSYPTAVINIIKTCKGGENSEQGAKRFKKDVLIYHPDVLFIDYALNGRVIGLDRAKKA
jgi:hypothetical protein